MSRSVQFYLDEHIGPVVRHGLRQRGVGVQTVVEAGRLGDSDEAHLAYALESGRVVVTRDSDFLVLHARGVGHARIAYASHKASPQRVLDGLLLIHAVLDADEIAGRVEFV